MFLMNFNLLESGVYLLAYFMGAIPFSKLISQAKGVDLSTIGSGNYGASNVYRALGIRYALLTFLLDLSKGLIPTYIAITLFANPFHHILVGATTVLGHMFSCFLRFRGGKGAATGIGVLVAIAPQVAALIIPIAAFLIWRFRVVSIATLISSLITPVLLWELSYPKPYFYTVTGICVFIFWAHRGNVKRLVMGKENKVR